jgi:hypothetical protein
MPEAAAAVRSERRCAGSAIISARGLEEEALAAGM